jgi:hypothetical protein
MFQILDAAQLKALPLLLAAASPAGRVRDYRLRVRVS